MLSAVLRVTVMLRYALPALVLTLSAAAIAVPGGQIGVLAPAAYACEMPGDATSAAGYRVDAENFTIANSNSYSSAMGRGTYLLTGDLLVLTSGPKRGQKFRRISDNFLRKLGPDGKETALRCVRKVVNNSNGDGCLDGQSKPLTRCVGTPKPQ